MANKFVPWIDDDGVEPGTTTQAQATFADDLQRKTGFVAGDPASAIRVNSALRQANVVAAALMQLADELKTLPDLDLNSSVVNIANALKASIITPIKDEIAAISGGSSSLTDRIDTLESEMDAVQSKDASQDSRISSLTSRVSSAERDIGNLEEEIANLSGGSTTLTDRIETLESEMNTAQSDINTLESEMNTAQSDINAVEGRLDDLEGVYERDIAASSWSGSAGNFTVSITAATHGRGTRPRVHTYVNGEETYDSPTIDWSTGNVTLHSSAKIAIKVLIY